VRRWLRRGNEHVAKRAEMARLVTVAATALQTPKGVYFGGSLANARSIIQLSAATLDAPIHVKTKSGVDARTVFGQR